MDAECWSTLWGSDGCVFVRASPRAGSGKRLVDGDVDTGNPGVIHAAEGDQVTPIIHHRDIHVLSQFARLRLTRLND